MHGSPLSHELNIYTELRARIAKAHGLAEDDEAVLDTVEGETSLHKIIAATAHEAKITEAEAVAIGTYIDELHQRKARYEAKADNLRAAVLWAIQEAGLPGVKTPTITISVTAGRRKLTIDQPRLPAEFLKAKTTYSPDREAIDEAVANGNVPEGVEIGNSAPSLRISIK